MDPKLTNLRSVTTETLNKHTQHPCYCSIQNVVIQRWSYSHTANSKFLCVFAVSEVWQVRDVEGLNGGGVVELRRGG